MEAHAKHSQSGSEAPAKPRGVELNGINSIDAREHRGQPRELFWPWFAANISVLGVSYGSFLLGFGISFWQATIVGAVGIVLSFLLCGFIALSGKRGHAPTMTLSRAASEPMGTGSRPPFLGYSPLAGRPCWLPSLCLPPPRCSPNWAWVEACR